MTNYNNDNDNRVRILGSRRPTVRMSRRGPAGGGRPRGGEGRGRVGERLRPADVLQAVVVQQAPGPLPTARSPPAEAGHAETEKQNNAPAHVRRAPPGGHAFRRCKQAKKGQRT